MITFRLFSVVFVHMYNALATDVCNRNILFMWWYAHWTFVSRKETGY